MTFEPAAVESTDAQWVAEQQRWAKGWRRVVFPFVFLVWLVQVATAIPKDSHGFGLIVGYAVLVAFCVTYVYTVPVGWWPDDRRYRKLIVALAVLLAAELPFAHADTFIMGVFVSAVAVIKYGERALFVPGILTLLAIILPPAVHSWHEPMSIAFNNGTAIAIPLTGLAMVGFGRVIYANRALAETRTELARLATENERTRIARDLHDLLGHSLTTISIKAELARRLAPHDTEGAVREISEVAALTRRALGDVRAAVSNYRGVNLAGELALARELLHAAGIRAELPPSVDDVDDATQSLFGWVLREGITNVVRHSHAESCMVRISATSVEILDDGIGTPSRCGNGLAGLAERVALVGGTIEAGPAAPRGWRLKVLLESGVSS